VTEADTGRLAAVKLRAIASTIGFNTSDATPQDFPFGAGLTHQHRGALYITRDHIRTIGPTLLWMQKHQISEVDLVIEGDAGIPARRAQALTCNLRVWQMHNGTLQPATPAPHLPKIQPPDSHEQFVGLIQQCGADVVREHGILTGEVLGLEICRVVDTPEGPKLEVGVGAIDRETSQLVHRHRSIEDSLTEVAQIVRQHRQPGAPHHPLGKMAGERLLRHHILNNPHLIGATTLQPAEPPLPRTSLRDHNPCVATGTNTNNTPIVAVFTDTIDIDIIGFAIDAQLREHQHAHITIATYTGNFTQSLRNVAESFAGSIELKDLDRN
jgi:hypothetical protein